MKLKFFIILALGIVFISVDNAQAADVSMTTNVQNVLDISLSSASINFGSLVPGTPVKGSGGIDIDVTTSSADGYNLSICDTIVGSDSALLHTDTTTRIPDFSSLIASPSLWNTGTSVGLGFGVYAADTSKEVKWGTGTTYDHASNQYAGVPENSTIFHASTGYKEGADTTSLAFILDVSNSQKTGSYTGQVVITATAIIP